MGESVVTDLISELPENKPYNLDFDKLFTTPKLTDGLSKRNIGATGTMRTNRTEDCPL